MGNSEGPDQIVPTLCGSILVPKLSYLGQHRFWSSLDLKWRSLVWLATDYGAVLSVSAPILTPRL